MTHLPSEADCSKGRGREEDCRKTAEEERRVPKVHVDCMLRKDKRWRSFRAGKKETMVVFGRVVPRTPTGEWIRGRLMAWLQETGLEFVDIIVQSDTEPWSTSLMESRSNLRAMHGGSRMIVERSRVGGSNSNGTCERVVQSVQGRVGTLRISIEGRSRRYTPSGQFLLTLQVSATERLHTKD